ncbi:DUF3995 domain-containing protein [Kitasatospora sp. NPDC051853]|uniref:DUF3995 domain-containing protein n=1 Tax=Kitasatospora sp. NPDC051853 TaxID=3364058 RepID=UPI0037930885
MGTDGTRAAAAVAAAGLFAAGALHLVWTVSPWPLGSAAELAEAVVGVTEDQLPPTGLTLAVAGLLGAAGGLVLARPGSGAWVVRAGVWTVSGVLLVRGLGGLVVSGAGLGEAPEAFRRWDLALYSPLCVALGGLAGYVALRARRRG